MKKPVYKLLDEKGRVLIPLEMRQKAEIEKGDILKVSINTGKIVISKVHFRGRKAGCRSCGGLCPCSRKDHEP